MDKKDRLDVQITQKMTKICYNTYSLKSLDQYFSQILSSRHLLLFQLRPRLIIYKQFTIVGQRCSQSKYQQNVQTYFCYIGYLQLILIYLMKKRVVCGGVCMAVFLGIAIFTLVGLDSLIDGVVLDGVVLAPETYDLWGANPGSSGTVTLRNFTFYNFTNPRGFLYRYETPVFNELAGYAYQQRSNFTNLTYSEDKSIINFNFWLYFTVLDQSRDVNETITVMNLAPLGFWNQLDSVDISALAIQGFGGLFVQMNNTIKIQAIGQGVAGQYLPKRENWDVYCALLGFDKGLCDWLWDDAFYGLGDQDHYQPWVQWFYKGDLDSGMALTEYFGLDGSQIYNFGRLFKDWCGVVNQIIDDWYCGGQSCTDNDLTWLQLGSGGLTANPPSGDPVDSICMSGNITCEGFPQLYSYYKYVFLNNTVEPDYKNLSFSRETVSNLFLPYRGTLLNVGNLSELYRVGRALEGNRGNRTLIDKLVAITHAESEFHAWVIWKYAQYFAAEFVLKTSEGGIRKFAGLAGVFTQALIQSMNQFNQWILPEFVGLLVAEQIADLDCKQFIIKNVETVDSKTAEKICANVDKDNFTTFYDLVQPCQNALFGEIFKKQNGLKGIMFSELCDQNNQSLYTLAAKAHEKIYTHYGCAANTHAKRCTAFELGAKQFFNSEITMKPIPSNLKQYPSVLSGKQWNKQLQQFQYRNYLREAYNDPWVDKQTFSNYSRVASLLSYDKFYSVPGMQDLLLEKNQTKFQEKYYWNNPRMLLGYINFLTIEVGFGGVTQQRTVNELLFGYQDQFLANLKEMDTMLGGDPSIQTKVMINQPNSTLQQAVNKPQSMYSGYSDPLLTRIYTGNMGYDHVTYNKTSYTGYEVVSEQVNPFRRNLTLFGTDAFQNLPMSTPEDDQYIYIDTLYRIAEMNYTNSEEKYGFDVLRYHLSNNTMASQKDFKPNEDFYQYFTGLMNLSFLGLPLFASKNHFLGTDPYWLTRVKMYDESGQFLQLPSENDESYLVTQPKSGVTFSALLYLQTSVYMQPDVLFPYQPVMMPVFTLFRSANLSQSSANDILGDLKTALGAPKKMLLASIVGVLVMGLCITCCLMRQRKSKTQTSLLQSTDNAMEQEVIQQEKQSRDRQYKVRVLQPEQEAVQVQDWESAEKVRNGGSSVGEGINVSVGEPAA